MIVNLKKIPTNYPKIFRNRLIIITGVGRSGTTILGKILGSTKNALYVFEPAIIKYCSADFGLLGALFEDYFLPQAQGRLNPNPNDWTYYRNQVTDNELRRRWAYNNRRNDALKWIEDNDIKFIIKMPEFHQYHDIFKSIYANLDIKWINILRNGFDVINSALERNWYTDEYCNNNLIDWVWAKDVNVPAFVDDQSKKMWGQYNQVTRCAAVWRCLTEKEIDGFELLYENFCEEPNLFIDTLIDYCGLTKTPLTDEHIKSVKSHKKIETNRFELKDIHPAERDKFIKCLCDLGYTI